MPVCRLPVPRASCLPAPVPLAALCPCPPVHAWRCVVLGCVVLVLCWCACVVLLVALHRAHALSVLPALLPLSQRRKAPLSVCLSLSASLCRVRLLCTVMCSACASRHALVYRVPRTVFASCTPAITTRFTARVLLHVSGFTTRVEFHNACLVSRVVFHNTCLHTPARAMCATPLCTNCNGIMPLVHAGCVCGRWRLTMSFCACASGGD